MTVGVHSWLPAECLLDDRLRRLAAAAVAEWSAAWFVRRRFEVTRWQASAEMPSREAWRSDLGALPFRLSPSAGRRLVDLALDTRTETASGDADHQLIGRFEHRLLSDLSSRLRAAFDVTDGGEDGVVPAPAVVVSIADASTPELLAVALPVGAVIAARKRLVGPPRPAARRPQSRPMAVSASRVELRTVVGRSRLPLQAIGELAVGDVLVLDTGVDDKLAMVLPGADRPLMHAAMSVDDGGLTLTLRV